MENFPTPQRQMLPWVANVATLAVMVAATWWSSDQRPDDPVQAATVAMPSPVAMPPVHQPVVAPAPAATQAIWPAQTTSLQGDGLKPVSYGSTVLR
jgi:hypothetical protein